MSVRRAQAEIDAVEFAEWKKIDEVFDPLPPWRDDFRIAKLIAEMYTLKLQGEQIDPLAFMPQFDQQPEDDVALRETRIRNAAAALRA